MGGVKPLTGAAGSLMCGGDGGEALVAKGGCTNTGTVTIGGNGYSVFESNDNTAKIHVDTDIAVTVA